MWELGTPDRHLATCLRASVANNTVEVNPLQSDDQIGLELKFHFVFSRFRFFPFCIFRFSISFSFKQIFTFPFALTDSLFLR